MPVFGLEAARVDHPAVTHGFTIERGMWPVMRKMTPTGTAAVAVTIAIWGMASLVPGEDSRWVDGRTASRRAVFGGGSSIVEMLSRLVATIYC